MIFYSYIVGVRLFGFLYLYRVFWVFKEFGVVIVLSTDGVGVRIIVLFED